MSVSYEFVCCQVEVFATGRLLVQRSPTDYVVCLNTTEESHKGGPDPFGLSSEEKGKGFHNSECNSLKKMTTLHRKEKCVCHYVKLLAFYCCLSPQLRAY